ncbi:hypothetical protein R3P38DRAFT_3208767 [Favolaschia claudopus]|uniref:Uncharacterized protein n=1 Tax=Favolaschia claudopus TaxID=2862362 RepID=A0AAW0AIF0_9AGAR
MRTELFKAFRCPIVWSLSVSDLRLLDLLDAPALQELHCPYYSAMELDHHLSQFSELRKQFVGESYIDDWPSFMRSVRTVTSLYSEDWQKGLGKSIDQDQLMRAVEAQWRHGRLRSFRMYAMKFRPSESTLNRVETLRREGMDIDFEYTSRCLYEGMVPHDFRLYDDGYGLVNDSMEAGGCYSFSTT